MKGRARWRLVIAAWVLLGATFIAGLGGEVALRVQQRLAQQRALAFATPNPFHVGRAETEAADTRLWLEPWQRYRPGAEIDTRIGDTRLQVRINRWGYRGADWAVPRPAGRLRVACIGGSTTVQGRTDDTTYPALLAAALRERDPSLDVEVLNLGVSGTRSDHWLANLDELLRYQPDVVVQYNAINDIAWEHLRAFSKQHPLRRAANRSLLFAALFPISPDALDPLVDRSFENFARLERALSARGISHLVGTFAIPDAARADPAFRDFLDLDVEEQWGRRMRLHRYPEFAAWVARFDRRLEDFAAANRLRLVELHRALADPALFVDTCHMTPEGIERLARGFLPAVEQVLAERGAAQPISAAGAR